MATRYRTSAANHDGGTGRSMVERGLAVDVASPLMNPIDETATNPEQLLALAWATCLNATAQAVVAHRHRTSVRVEVALRDAVDRVGYEFTATAFVSGEGLDPGAATTLAEAAHARCPVSRLLAGSPLIAVEGEPYRQ